MTEQKNNELEKITDFLAADDDHWDSDNKEPVVDHDAHYQNKRFLAAGGMKEIYEVYDPKTRRNVAMAELRKDGPLWHCESFLEEAHLTASLVHPNIITVHTVGVRDDGSPYFTMELKIGHTLRELVENMTDRNELLQVFLKICDAVSYAHSLGVVHLDIKPDNVQVGEHGLVKLCDWGLACRIDEIEDEQKLIRGTPGFMSPEQVTKGRLGCHSDIYSLGALLHFILTGESPFAGGFHTKMSSTLEGNLRSKLQTNVNIQVSDSLDAVVRRAMAKEPQNRYLSVDALKADVAKFLSGFSTTAEDAGLLKECVLFYKRNKAACMVAAALVLVLTVTVVVFVYNLNQSKNRIAQSLAEVEQARIKETEAYRESEENYKKYIAEKDAQIRANEALKSKRLGEAFAVAQYPLFFLDPVTALSRSLDILLEESKGITDHTIEQEIATNLFISHQFDQISDDLPSSVSPLAEISVEYRDCQKNAYGVLRFIDFLRLLQDLNKLGDEHRPLRDSIMERMLYYYKAKEGRVYVDYRILMELVKSMNPEWEKLDGKFNRNPRKITMVGRGLTNIRGTGKYTSKKCIFALLNLKLLRFRSTGITDQRQFEGLTLERLDISNNEIHSLLPYSTFKGILAIQVAVGQIPEDMVKNAPQNLKIWVGYKQHTPDNSEK